MSVLGALFFSIVTWLAPGPEAEAPKLAVENACVPQRLWEKSKQTRALHDAVIASVVMSPEP
jgi:hypothetical protein